MGVKSVIQEVKLKVSASRMFKALATEMGDVLPKATASIDNIQILEGRGFAPGCVFKTNFPEGGKFKYLKYRIEAMDPGNYATKSTVIEGDALGDKVEKICYDYKIEETGDGGCVVKLKADYHTKSGEELSDEEIKAGNEGYVALYKECEGYLLANPHVCA